MNQSESQVPPKPAMLIVSDSADLRSTMTTDLGDAYGARYEIIAASSPSEALNGLERLAERNQPVALILTDHPLKDMPDREMSGIDFLVQASARHPHAQRAILAEYGNLSRWHELTRAMTLGHVDAWVPKPWASPEEWLIPVTAQLLGEWAQDHLPRYEWVRVVDSRWDPTSRLRRDALSRSPVPHGFYLIDDPKDPTGRKLLEERGLLGTPLPAFIFEDGQTLSAPTNAEIVEAVGGLARPPKKEYDLAIIGCGAAGLAAAVYGASDGLETIVIEKYTIGGQATSSSMIRNYFGFPFGVTGKRLALNAWGQASAFGADIAFTQRVVGLRRDGQRLALSMETDSPFIPFGSQAEEQVTARAVVIATGVKWRRLGDEINRLEGKGVYYGASAVEAQAMTDSRVFVVGGGNSAGQIVAHLAKYAPEVNMLVRGESLAASLSAYLVRQIRTLEEAGKVNVRLNVEVLQALGENKLESLEVKDRVSGETEIMGADALFIMIGAEADTDWLANAGLQCDRRGFILTGRDLDGGNQEAGDRDPLYLETNIPGVFAAGDVRHGSTKRVAGAVGEGATAVQLIHEYLREAGG